MNYLCTVILSLCYIIHIGDFSSVQVMSDQLYSDVQKWSSELERPVFVYHGLSSEIKCVPTDAVQSDQSKYVWLDDYGKQVLGSRFMKLHGGVLRLSSSELDDTGFYTCVVMPLSANASGSSLSSSNDSNGVLSHPDINKTYKGMARYRHSLIVLRMPTINLQYLYMYLVPACDKERITMKMNWFSQKKVEVARSSDAMLQRFKFRVGAPNCSLYYVTERGGWKSKRSRFILVVQATVDGSDVIFRNLTSASVDFFELNTIKLLLNVTLKTAERFRDEELASRITDDLVLNGEPVFPEFEFDAGKFGYAVDAECGYGYELIGDGDAGVLCVPCLPGTYHEKLNNTCVLCPVGSYQDKMAQVRCEPCPDYLPTVNPGARNDSECYWQPWLVRKVPSHFLVFASLVCIVFVVNLGYVLIMRHHRRPVSYTTLTSQQRRDDHRISSADESAEDNWNLPARMGWHSVPLTSDSRLEDRPLLMQSSGLRADLLQLVPFGRGGSAAAK